MKISKEIDYILGKNIYISFVSINNLEGGEIGVGTLYGQSIFMRWANEARLH